MTQSNREQNRTSDNTQRNQSQEQENQRQNASSHGQQDENSQDGAEWNNYQTRELGDQKYDQRKNRGAGAE